MPYLPSEAAKKSEKYNNIINVKFMNNKSKKKN